MRHSEARGPRKGQDAAGQQEKLMIRPTVRFLTDDMMERIVAEARELLSRLGVEIHNETILDMLQEKGANVDRERNRAFIQSDMVDQALATVPESFRVYDALGRETLDLGGMNVHFTPGSAAIRILDYETEEARDPVTADYVRYAKLMGKLDHIASQSTAMVTADVPEVISDSYRLFLSLLHCEKPVVTGAFTIESFQTLKDLQLAIRGTEGALAAKPLTIFSCCPTSPLKWSDVTSQNVVDCARLSIPVEFISMPLSGFQAPVTQIGTLIQHTAETVSGLVISQLTKPGAPVLYGGSPAIFDVRYETTPMGAIETQMIACAYNEIGKHLGMPTQAYISLSDSKLLDAQAGQETAMGATLAALAGINNISGPGMLDFESCQSLEKLVMDNETCGMMLRMIRGIEPKEDFPSLPLFEELLSEQHLLIASHTRRFLREEHYFTGPVLDRANRSRWLEEGGTRLSERAHEQVEMHIAAHEPSGISEDSRRDMIQIMEEAASKAGMDNLPEGWR